jgi:hypothetical protein
LKSLEEKFRQSKRSHTFVESISLVRTPRGPKAETRTPEPDHTQPSAPLDQGEPTLPTPASVILEGLRQDWLTREPSVQPENEEPAQTGRKSCPKQQITMPSYTPFLESVKASLRKAEASVETRPLNNGETERSAARFAMIMLVGLAVLLAIGVLLYVKKGS